MSRRSARMSPPRNKGGRPRTRTNNAPYTGHVSVTAATYARLKAEADRREMTMSALVEDLVAFDIAPKGEA